MIRKTVLAGILASVIAPFSAHAALSISGTLAKSLDYGNVKDSNSQLSLQDMRSYISIGGTDRVNENSQLEWSVQSFLEHGFGSREAWAAYLNEDLGLLKLGKTRIAYSELIDEFDLFESNTTLGNTFNNGYFSVGSNRPGSVIYYKTPDLDGFQAKVSYMLPTGIEPKANSYNGMLSYTLDDFELYAAALRINHIARNAVDVDQIRFLPASSAQITNYQIGAKVFPLEDLQVGVLYQSTKQSLAKRSHPNDLIPMGITTGNTLRRNAILFETEYSIDKWTPRAGYVHQFIGRVSNQANINTADQYQIGFDFSLSKHSTWYTEAAYINNHGQNQFSTSISNGANTGKVISTGLIASF